MGVKAETFSLAVISDLLTKEAGEDFAALGGLVGREACSTSRADAMRVARTLAAAEALVLGKRLRHCSGVNLWRRSA